MAIELNSRQEWDDPRLPQYENIHVTMSEAMFSVLSSFGFAVAYTDNDLSPHDLWVTAAPEKGLSTAPRVNL